MSLRSFSLGLLLALCGMNATGPSVVGDDPVAVSLDRAGEGTESAFIVRQLPESLLRRAGNWDAEQWRQVLVVHTVEGERLAPVPLLGDYQLNGDKLVFTPRYPLRPGLKYRVALRIPGAKEVSRDFDLPEPKHESARLTAIYPTTDVVPENLLKFYFHFSAPMSRAEIYRRVKLIDSTGKQVEFPFLELSEELWSPDGMRVTLYFDPGRIKRGLKPRELFGPALMEGHAYALRIDPRWLDATGKPLAGPESLLVKSFRVVEPDDRQPDVKGWKVIPPAAGTRSPLTIAFDEPLDSAMLLRVVSILDASGAEVPGDRQLGKSEMSWTFQPAVNWKPGRYSISVANTLEDLAGNSLGRPFEVDVFRPAPTVPTEEFVTIPFSVSGP